jgi:hypothetical protein
MEFENVKAACKSGGKKPAISAEHDGQAGDDSRESEPTHEDGDDFQPISGRAGLGGRALDPFIPTALLLGTGAMVVTQVPTELGRIISGMTAFHEELKITWQAAFRLESLIF